MKTADTAYINGRVYTADKEFSIRSAFALSGDRFIAAGSDEEIRALCSSQTKIIDLKGRTVLPGLIDSHLHINNTGAMKLELDIVGKQKQEIVNMVAKARQKAHPGEWIVGRGWLNDEWPDSSFPTKEEPGSTAKPLKR